MDGDGHRVRRGIIGTGIGIEKIGYREIWIGIGVRINSLGQMGMGIGLIIGIEMRVGIMG